MTLVARHLETRRPRKDRDVTWSRKCERGQLFLWTLWRRDHRRVIHMLIVSATLETVGWIDLFGG